LEKGENVGWGLDTYACSLNVDFEMPVLHALKNAERWTQKWRGEFKL